MECGYAGFGQLMSPNLGQAGMPSLSDDGYVLAVAFRKLALSKVWRLPHCSICSMLTCIRQQDGSLWVPVIWIHCFRGRIPVMSIGLEAGAPVDLYMAQPSVQTTCYRTIASCRLWFRSCCCAELYLFAGLSVNYCPKPIMYVYMYVS